MGWMKVIHGYTAYVFIAALVNYFLSIKLIFRHNAKWRTPAELLVYFVVVAVIGIIDMYITVGFVSLGSPPWLAMLFTVIVFGDASRSTPPPAVPPSSCTWKPKLA